MDHTVQPLPLRFEVTDHRHAWRMVVDQLRMEMSKASFDTWVQPLEPLSYKDSIFTLRAYNAFGRDWVENRLKSRITRLLEGLYGEPVTLHLVVDDLPAENREFQPETISEAERSRADKGQKDVSPPLTPSRKVMLQRAYGTERARVIQPERGMFLTLYFFSEWLPLIGHSAMAVILAARSMCYWNPMTGELRNTVETDMSTLAARASVSVRTVKDVLNNELVERYFLRYKVRRVMTPNGVRTAGIVLQVRMDDPLTPADQVAYNLPEEEIWYLPEFSKEDERD